MTSDHHVRRTVSETVETVVEIVESTCVRLLAFEYSRVYYIESVVSDCF